MSTDANEALATRIVEEVWNQGNLALLDELYAPEDRSQSREQFKEAVRVYREAFPDLKVTIDLMVAAGDAVMYRWTVRGTHKGAIRGLNASDVLAGPHAGAERPLWLTLVEPTGIHVAVVGASSYRIRDGKIISAWILIDQPSLLQQIGALPLPVPGAKT